MPERFPEQIHSIGESARDEVGARAAKLRITENEQYAIGYYPDSSHQLTRAR